jgi:tetratricopeptide (TPR) repeat protein
VKSWYLNWKASRLIGGGDFAAARTIYSRLAGMDEKDAFARLMLAMCHEREGRIPDALHMADEAIRIGPESLPALQTAARLAVAAGDHEKAAQCLRSALALPEVRTEMPQDIAVFNALAWVLRVMGRLPVLRRRVRAQSLADALRHLDAGHRATDLQDWKRWAQEYVAWQAGNAPPPSGTVVH